jgi:chromosome segregation ATPase
MNAVLTEVFESDESELMPTSEKDDLPIQVAELRADVRHIQSDVSDIKIELRATNQRIDALSDKMDKRFDAMMGEMNQRFDSARGETNQRFDAMSKKTDQNIDSLKGEMDKRFDAAKGEVNQRFDKVDARFDRSDARMDRMEAQITGILVKLESWKVWALWLYVVLAGTLLGVMAKGFKWF